jgi:serine/threonine protein phosphatase PrpC
VGNVGDSRCVACVDGIAEPLSIDHKPSDENEKRRIVEAGGFVEVNRVNGNLASNLDILNSLNSLDTLNTLNTLNSLNTLTALTALTALTPLTPLTALTA